MTLEASVVAHSATVRELDATSNLAFAANYYDDRQRTAGILNVRYYPDQSVGQNDVSSLNAADLREVDAEFQKQLREASAAAGIDVIEWRGTTSATD